MWGIGIVCLLLGLLVQLSIDCRVVEASSEEISFRASVRKDALIGVASCVHAFSQVELLNLDPSEPIVIRSVTTSPESISVISSDALTLDTSKIPQQIHVSQVSELTLGPQQIAIVPLTFLPRFPENDDLTASPEPSSAAEPGENGVARSNLGYQAEGGEFEVHTNIMLDTSRGFLKLPIVATSFRQNGYGLPQVIYFREGLIPATDGQNRVTVVSNDLESVLEVYDCFNMHLSNPSKEKELQILEVFLSRPDLISIFHEEHDTFDAELTQTFKDVQRSIGPGVSDEYVLTLCNAPSAHPPNSPIQNANVPRYSFLNSGLGYLQIRTDDNVLMVKLEQLGDDVPPVSGELDSFAESSLASVVKSPSIAIPYPTHINVQLAPSVNETHSSVIVFHNMSPYTVMFAHINLVTPFVDGSLLNEEAVKLGVEMNARVGKLESRHSSMLEETIVLTFSISPKPTLGNLLINRPFTFTGSLIVRTSFDIETTCEECKDVIQSDPHRDSNLTIEIPYEVTVTDPSLYLVTEKSITAGTNFFNALFFPLRRFEGRLQGDTNNSTGSIHDLHILSSVHRVIAVSDIKIIDSQVDRTDKWEASLCRRFKLSAFDPTPTPSLWRNSSLYDLGKMSLTYNMDKVLEPKSKRNQYEGKAGVLIDDGLVLPHTCYLSIDPTLQVPLILVTGKLDVATSEFAIGQKMLSVDTEHNTSRREAFNPSLNAGFEEVIRWLRSSGMGPSLKKALKFIFNGRKLVDTNDGTAMLAVYLANLCAESFSVGASLRPILLKLGAVVHGEVHTSFLYLTNHNPVTIKVSVDVGQVEGMSIALARDFSHAKGGSTSILDRLPRIDEIENAMITKGRWIGHTRRGLIQFLLSSEFSQAFSASLPYRDDVSLSSAAVKTQPLLQYLYKQRHVAHFHAFPISPYLLSSEASACPGLDMHPPGYDEISPNGTDSLLPLIMTDTLSVSRHLNVCYDINGTLNPHRHAPAIIPPGGVARFEVKVRCPPRHSLHTDITRFLATGLVLSTDRGQIMPVIVTFDALLGHLHVSPTSSKGTDNATSQGTYDEAVVVPAGLFLTRASPEDLESKQGILIEPHESRNDSIITRRAPVDVGINGTENAGVPLFITSSFMRNVILKGVESCNPWFEVRLLEHEVINDAEASEGVGTIHSVIPCQPFQYEGGSDDFRLDFPGKAPQFPSFYECALDWLQKRVDLQRRGCGLTRMPVKGWNDRDITEDEVQTMAVKALSQAVHYSLISFNDGVPRRYSHRSKSSDDKEEVGLKSRTDIELEMQSATKENNQNIVSSHLESKKPLSIRETPFVRQVALDIFSQLNDVWGLVTESELHLLRTNLRAKINYERNTSTSSGMQAPERELQTLSVAMQDVAIRTSLEMPKLVDHSRLHNSQPSDPAEPAVLQFPPTLVAEVAALMIPLRNPTSVPIRVRLAALGKPEKEVDKDIYNEIGVNFLRPDVRDRYLKSYDSMYVQDGNGKDELSEGDALHWWEGAGAYFMPDDRGDLIQARYNLSITAGPGAHISMVNPSLHAFNGLLMACGTRCGVGEDQETENANPGFNQKSNQPMMRNYSPIGASSAAGATLLGQSRPAKLTLGSKEHCIAAGGSTPADPAHLAFAIPYESLGEIVLPPYSTGELGPILFRPPGRYSVLGCDTADESKSTPLDTKTSRSCSSKFFESLVFLENSLTGLERVVVRGRGMWERVVFLDPTPSEASSEAFGDVEYRYGRPTLVFPGSAASEPDPAKASPLRKEVVVHNDGDTLVEFGHVYFSKASDMYFASRTNKQMARRTVKKVTEADVETSCQMRGFRLLGCSEGGSLEIKQNGERARNLRHGFALSPGQNLSLFVEHYPDCTYNTEYVTLNFAHRDEKSNHTSWSTGSSRSRHRIGSDKVGGLSRRKIELLVGFDMSADEMASCVPDTSVARSTAGDKRCSSHFILSSVNDTEPKVCYLQERRNGFVAWSIFFAVRTILLCFSAFLAYSVVEEHNLRRQACMFFRSHLRGLNGVGQHQKVSSSSESDWSAAFRCLARADPLSSELQALGREQARQLVLNRYKSMGAISPHCISSAGVFLRDRAGAVVGAGRKGSGGSVLAGSEKRTMTLSDAMFKEAFTDQVAESESILLIPCSLGWGAAAESGVLRKSSHFADFALKSRELLNQRGKSQVDAARPESASFDHDEESFGRYDDEHDDASVKIEGEVVRMVKKVEVEDIAVEAIASTDENDEQKGDVISTSDESEGTAAALKDLEMTPKAVPTPDADPAGFAEVGSQKATSHSRHTTKKKSSEDEPVASAQVELTKSKNQKDARTDASRSPGVKQKIDAKTKNRTASQKAPRERHGKGVPNDSPMTRSRGQLSSKLVEKNADGVYDLAWPKGREAKNTSIVTSSVPSKAANKTGAVLPHLSPKSTSAPSSVQSSPSSVGQVSVSSRSTTRSDDRMSLRDPQSYRKRAGIRPPPGLAPPPGFGGDGRESIQPIGSNDGLPPLAPTLAFNGSADLTSLPLGSSVLGSTLFPFLGEDAPPEPSVVPSLNSSPMPSSEKPLTGAMKKDRRDPQASSGFDVMVFLDSILDDRSSLENKEESLGDLLAENTSGAIAALPVSSDPWATERKSRAAAYGINVEHHAGEDDDDVYKTDEIVYAILASANRTNGESTTSLQNSVPLLTPSAMLAANVDETEDPNNSTSVGVFSRSFYSSLLEE